MPSPALTTTEVACSDWPEASSGAYVCSWSPPPNTSEPMVPSCTVTADVPNTAPKRRGIWPAAAALPAPPPNTEPPMVAVRTRTETAAGPLTV